MSIRLNIRVSLCRLSRKYPSRESPSWVQGTLKEHGHQPQPAEPVEPASQPAEPAEPPPQSAEPAEHIPQSAEPAESTSQSAEPAERTPRPVESTGHTPQPAEPAESSKISRPSKS